MSLPLWGLLEKALGTAQTIDEAIAQAIVAHEEDPTSHLGAGESLQAHKSDSVIDHPAQSVVLDKTPYQDYSEFQQGIGLQDWSNEVGSWSSNIDTQVAADLFNQTEFQGLGFTTHASGANYPDRDLMYQFKLRLNYFGPGDGAIEFGFTNDLITSGSRMVFVLDSGVWKWKIYSAAGEVHTFSISSAGRLFKFYRIFWDSVNEEIVLYEGTTIISTYATVDWKDYIFSYIAIEMSRVSNRSVGFVLNNWKSTYAIDIDI